MRMEHVRNVVGDASLALLRRLFEAWRGLESARVWAFADVIWRAIFGENYNIRQGAIVESGSSNSNDVTLRNGAFSSGKKDFKKNTNENKGASIGSKAAMLARFAISERSMVGVGAATAINAPTSLIVFGNPVRKVLANNSFPSRCQFQKQ